MDTIKSEPIPGTIEETRDQWKHFHEAVQSLGEFADQVERSLRPTAKQQFVQALDIAGTLHLLDTVNDRITAKIEDRNRLNYALGQAKVMAEEAKAMLLLGGTIDGKNDKTRDAQMLLALKDDPAYIEAHNQVDGAERAIAGCDVDLESLRGQQAALKVKLRLIAAQLEYLAEPR